MMTKLRSFSISLHGTVPMKVGAVLFIRGGRRISISRYGSCEMSHTDDCEVTERHLEVHINLGENRIKKKNLRQTTGYAMCSF